MAWAGILPLADGFGAKSDFRRVLHWTIKQNNEKRLWHTTGARPLIAIFSVDGCSIFGHENELFSFGFSEVLRAHSPDNVRRLVRVPKTKQHAGETLRDIMKRYEEELLISDFITELEDTELTVCLANGDSVTCAVEPFAVADWPALLSLVDNVAPAGSHVPNAELCPVCDFRYEDKAKPWRNGPFRVFALFTDDEFSERRNPLWPFSRSHFLYAPLHCWARVLCHLLVAILEYGMPMFKGLKVCLLLFVAICHTFFAHTAKQTKMNSLLKKYGPSWADSSIQFGKGRALFLAGVHSRLVAWLRTFPLNVAHVVRVVQSEEDWVAKQCTAIFFADAVDQMFTFVWNLHGWLHDPETDPAVMQQLARQRWTYLAMLEGMDTNLPPAVHYMLHHALDVYGKIDHSLRYFLEEAYEAAHHQDKWFSVHTMWGRACLAQDTYNSCELLLAQEAVWASLVANGTVSRYAVRWVFGIEPFLSHSCFQHHKQAPCDLQADEGTA